MTAAKKVLIYSAELVSNRLLFRSHDAVEVDVLQKQLQSITRQ